ncbi:MAG: DMT family transporter [Spirochaetia bacterium]
MDSRAIRADFFMLITAAVWGFAFVAQRIGMEYVGPFTFNGVRFLLGGLSLVPFLFIRPVGADSDAGDAGPAREPKAGRLKLQLYGMLAGVALFLGASFQQVGIVYTSAGNAGFITGLYVIIVPILGLVVGRRPGIGVWIGALLAVAGMYLLNEAPGVGLNIGDALVLACALFFALHVLLLGRISPMFPAVPLSIIQFFTCALLSLLTALWQETIVLADILAAAVPILYGGIGSVGIAYTLQVIAQKDAPPAHAAIILSLESVFALIGGVLLLGEAAVVLKIIGAGLMLAGMLAAQVQRYFLNRSARRVVSADR